MANVRYMGGKSTTLGTKEIDANGIYNASSDNLDGYSSVTVDVPAPSGSVNLQYTSNGTYMDVDVEDYETANITVNVPSQTIPTQEKDIIATTSQQVVTPDGGYLLNRVTVDPQRHMNTYTPATDTSNNDMGIIHNYRYVDTSGMITPAGTKEVEYTTNGTHTEDIKNYENIDIEVNVPVSGDLGTKTIITNGLYKAIDDNLDGYSEVDVNVPQNATLGIKTITNNGNYYATADGYDGFSRVDVNVSGAALQSSKTVTATTSQQTVTPDVGYDGMEQVIVNPQVHTQTYSPADNTAANDMGVNNNYRYVDTSGMYTPTSITPSNSTPAALTADTPVNPTTAGYAIESYSSITPSNSSPAALTSGDIYKATANGKAISSLSEVAPSNANPPSISNGGIYKINTRNGYLISTINIVEPSDSNPPLLSNNNSWYRLNGASGYLYSSSGLGKCKSGTVTLSTSGTTTVTCGFEPKYIALMVYKDATHFSESIYNKDVSTSNTYRGAINGGSSGCGASSFPVTSTSTAGLIMSTSSTGFKVAAASTAHGTNGYYFAIG